MSILHLVPYYPSVNARHAGGACMGKELEELEKIDDVISLSIVQKKYDYDLFCKEKKDNQIGILLKESEQIVNFMLHPGMPLLFAARCSKECKKEIKKILMDESLSAVYIEYATMGQYIKLIKKYRKDIKISLVLHDVTIQSYERMVEGEKNIIKRWLLKWQKRLIQKCEKKWTEQADNLLVFCDKDRKLLKKYYATNDNKISVISTYFELDKKEERLEKHQRLHDGTTNFFFYGQLSRKDNKDAALRAVRLFREFKKENPKSKLFIIGNAPDNEIKACEGDGIVCTGFVEDADRFIIENGDIALFPLCTGAGIKVKVLHCMALGIPVVTSMVGAEGIDEEGKCLYLAEKDEEYLEYMNKLKSLDNIEMIRKNNIELIKEKFGWDKTVNVLNELFKNLK